jgi:hypothetical protein
LEEVEKDESTLRIDGIEQGQEMMMTIRSGSFDVRGKYCKSENRFRGKSQACAPTIPD